MSETRDGRSSGLSDQELLAATPRGTGGREAQVGIFVLIGLISFLVVLFWMTDPATLRGRYMLVTTVDDAGGIRVGDPVQMSGVILGRVHDFEMTDVGEVDITVEIDGRWRVPFGSRARLGSSGLFGGRTMEIIPGESGQYLEEYDTIPGEGAGGGGLLGSVDELSGRAGSVLAAIDSLLDHRTIGSVQGSAEALESFLTELNAVTQEQRVALQRLTTSLNSAAGGFEEAAGAAPDIRAAAARADSAMVVLAATSENLDAATLSLRAVLERMERGEGTLGRLSADESLYVSLQSAAESLNALLADLQANPNRYINISIF